MKQNLNANVETRHYHQFAALWLAEVFGAAASWLWAHAGDARDCDGSWSNAAQ